MKNIYKKIRKIVWEISRFLLIKKCTDHLGKIEEHEDKIICYVNNKKFRKYKSYSYIFFSHINDKEIRNIVKLNKPIYYIIEDMIFDRRLQFFSAPNTYVKFKNCKFYNTIKITHADNVIFENNMYYNKFYDYLYNKCFLEADAQNIEFIDETFMDFEEKKKTSCFGMNLEVNNLKIIDSQIVANDNNGEINFKVKENLTIEDSVIFSPIIEIDSKNTKIEDSQLDADIGIDIKSNNLKIIDSEIGVYSSEDIINLKEKENLTIKDSVIYGSIIDIDSKNIEIEDSELNAIETINIKNENNNEIKNINSPVVVYNGLSMVEVEKITKENYELQTAKQNLINCLREIKNQCNNINDCILKKVNNNLNEQNVSKVLKK